VASLFKGDLNVYEVHNNGSWYNFGYLFGLACFFRGGGNRTSRRCGKSNIGAGAKIDDQIPSTRKYQEASLSPSSSELSAIRGQRAFVRSLRKVVITLRRKSQITHLESVGVTAGLSSLWVGHRPMGTQNPLFRGWQGSMSSIKRDVKKKVLPRPELRLDSRHPAHSASAWRE